MEQTVIKQHYHMISREKTPHGVIRVEAIIYAPRSEILTAFAALDEISKRDKKEVKGD